VIVVRTSPACSLCQSAKAAWEQARERANFKHEEIDITSAQERKLAAKHNIFSAPVTLIDNGLSQRNELEQIHPHSPHLERDGEERGQSGPVT